MKIKLSFAMSKRSSLSASNGIERTEVSSKHFWSTSLPLGQILAMEVNQSLPCFKKSKAAAGQQKNHEQKSSFSTSAGVTRAEFSYSKIWKYKSIFLFWLVTEFYIRQCPNDTFTLCSLTDWPSVVRCLLTCCFWSRRLFIQGK